MEIELRVKGIDCANCAAELEERINEIEGIEEATLNFLTEKLEIEVAEGVDEEDIINKVTELIKDEEPDAIVEEI